MARYISHLQELILFSESGKRLYQFTGGVLVVGDPETNVGAGNSIDPNFAGNEDQSLQVLNAAGGTDLQKAGLDTVFWEANVLGGGDAVTQGTWYQVVSGPVYLTNSTAGDEDLYALQVGNISVLPELCCEGEYLLRDLGQSFPGALTEDDLAQLARLPVGTRFKWTAANGNLPANLVGTIARALTPQYFDDEDHNLRCEHFKINNLSTFKDEACWDEVKWGAIDKKGIAGSTRYKATRS